MSGVWLRRGDRKESRHRCGPPRGFTDLPDGLPGDIWRCDCGRRWIIKRGLDVGDRVHWARRWLPWPRKSWQEKVEDGALL